MIDAELVIVVLGECPEIFVGRLDVANISGGSAAALVYCNLSGAILPSLITFNLVSTFNTKVSAWLPK